MCKDLWQQHPNSKWRASLLFSSVCSVCRYLSADNFSPLSWSAEWYLQTHTATHTHPTLNPTQVNQCTSKPLKNWCGHSPTEVLREGEGGTQESKVCYQIAELHSLLHKPSRSGGNFILHYNLSSKHPLSLIKTAGFCFLHVKSLHLEKFHVSGIFLVRSLLPNTDGPCKACKVGGIRIRRRCGSVLKARAPPNKAPLCIPTTFLLMFFKDYLVQTAKKSRAEFHPGKLDGFSALFWPP